MNQRVSTGLKGFDTVIDELRLGDNVVWQVDKIEEYASIVTPFIQKTIQQERKMVYIRFGKHEPLLKEEEAKIYCLEAKEGFESFATKVHHIIAKEGKQTFYVFDCLTELLAYWHTDLMIGNFFKVTCPFLYDLDTVAYFAIVRNAHTYDTIARIRETTQVLLDLYTVENKSYIHPLKVWERYSPTMFFPHLVEGEKVTCITASTQAAKLFSKFNWTKERLDHWEIIFEKAKEAKRLPQSGQDAIKKLLMGLLIGKNSKMLELCDRYFTLDDLLEIKKREIGTGFIGGKSVGMLLARKILEVEASEVFHGVLEAHDSFYLGSDIFYTYIVQNGWWRLRMKQKTQKGYFEYAKRLKEKLLHGKFPEKMREQFQHMLEYFGQSPIIVRSSSLLEDNFGNAFAGKYESVFCVNQGTPQERYKAFEQAIRVVYASMMNEDALKYRVNRGLVEEDEQMALLVQRVSGDYHGAYFFPHLAGVGNSSNLYVWDKSIDMNAGMLRLVFGLGTRAVDRIMGDYARIVCLDKPTRKPLVSYEDEKKFSQNRVDLLDLKQNILTNESIEDVLKQDIKTDKYLFASLDEQTMRRLRELGYSYENPYYLLDFEKLLKHTTFPEVMRNMLQTLAKVYDYPVDIEFTTNFSLKKEYKINLVQCRPLQTKGLGKAIKMPELSSEEEYLFRSVGNFMGGNMSLQLEYVIYVEPKAYLALSEQNKYAVARMIGRLNEVLKGRNILLIGPGRWGTTTPSLGVPVHFTELASMKVLCEVSYRQEGLMPELSYGSHFFQDLVETGIFYVALFEGEKEVDLRFSTLLEGENQLGQLIKGADELSKVIFVNQAVRRIYSDVKSQKIICI
jgi:hypothetical protein